MLKESLYRRLYPFVCVLCGAPSEQTRDLCLACQADLPWLNHYCQTCGFNLPDPSLTSCAACLRHPPPIQRLISLWSYEAPLTRFVTGLKFYQQLSFNRLLSDLLSEGLQAAYQSQARPSLIIPVPLHRRRQQQRGYNQALLLGKHISKRLHIPIAAHACQRNKATLAQAMIARSQRAANVKNAFSVKPSFTPPKHLAIIDDVVTTGATVNALARCLQQAGAEKIEVWCCARTQPSVDN